MIFIIDRCWYESNLIESNERIFVDLFNFRISFSVAIVIGVFILNVAFISDWDYSPNLEINIEAITSAYRSALFLATPRIPTTRVIANKNQWPRDLSPLANKQILELITAYK